MNIAFVTPELISYRGMQSVLHELSVNSEALQFDRLTDAIGDLPNEQVDLVIVDTTADDYAENIAALCMSAPPVVLLTAAEDPYVIRKALEAGARGSISKRTPLAEMMAALTFVAAGGVVIPPAALKRGLAQEAIPSQGLLTTRQVEILHYIVEGCSNKDIARRLDLSEGTVKLHVTAVLKALGGRNRTEAARIASERGIVDRRDFSAA